MIKVKLIEKKEKGSSSKVVYVPTRWSEVTFNQMIELQKKKDPVAVFSGIPLKEWKKVEARSYQNFLELLDFLTEPPKWSKSKKLILEGQEIDFGKIDIGVQDTGMYIDAQNILKKYLKGAKKKKINDLNECMPEIIAIYGNKALSGKYEYKEADRLVPFIRELPYERVFNIGTFFLTSLSASSNGRGILYRLLILAMRKGGPVRRLFTRNGVFTPRFIISLKQ